MGWLCGGELVGGAGRRRLSGWLRLVSVLRVGLAAAEVAEWVLWWGVPQSRFVSPVLQAVHPLLVAWSLVSLVTAGFLVRFALDAISVRGWWAVGDWRRKLGAGLLGANAVLGLVLAALSVVWAVQLPGDMEAHLNATLREVETRAGARLDLDLLQSHYGCCGRNGPWDWFAANASSLARLENTSRQLALAETGPLGCGPLREVSVVTAEAEGQLCALPDSCCQLSSRSCTSFFLLLADSHSDVLRHRETFHQRGCGQAIREDWVGRWVPLALFAPSLGILVAQAVLWRLLDTSAANAGAAVGAEGEAYLIRGPARRSRVAPETAARERWRRMARASALVWAWDPDDVRLRRLLPDLQHLPDSPSNDLQDLSDPHSSDSSSD